MARRSPASPPASGRASRPSKPAAARTSTAAPSWPASPTRCLPCGPSRRTDRWEHGPVPAPRAGLAHGSCVPSFLLQQFFHQPVDLLRPLVLLSRFGILGPLLLGLALAVENVHHRYPITLQLFLPDAGLLVEKVVSDGDLLFTQDVLCLVHQRLVRDIIEADGNGDEALITILLLHLNQMRQRCLAGASVGRPE